MKPAGGSDLKDEKGGYGYGSGYGGGYSGGYGGYVPRKG
uniref:Uncharacterized protein n=1 Tax=Arundo donax TaxID=35708 RepID=A0A0A9BWN8_ARUDO